MWWIVAVVAVVVLVATYVTWIASRLDRLHARAAAAYDALDAHLVRRAAAPGGLARALGPPGVRPAARAGLEASWGGGGPAENEIAPELCRGTVVAGVLDLSRVA